MPPTPAPVDQPPRPAADEKSPGAPQDAAGSLPALEMVGVAIGSMRDFRRTVLEEVNWTVARGEFWAIGGLQASGKSDLLAVAAGLLQPLRGTYRVFGRELQAGYEHELLAARLRVGLVFDGGGLLHQLTLAENVLLPLRYHGRVAAREAEQRARALLDCVGLAHHAESLPGALGLNWQQRVGLARALALQPEVLLLDSPLTGLNPHDSAWWLETLGRLASGHPLMDGQPMTLVVTAHDLRPWRGRARQFAVLHDRRFVPLEQRMETRQVEEALLETLLGKEGAK